MSSRGMVAKIDILCPKESCGPEPSLKWEEIPVFANIWAEAIFPEGKEYWKEQAFNAEIPAMFLIRSRRGIIPGMAVRYKGELYRIESTPPKNGNSRRYMILKCKDVRHTGF